MPVFQLPADVLRVGEPTPFALRDRSGKLLIPRGMVVASEEQRQQLAARDLYVDEQEGELLRRAIAGKVDALVRKNALLGQIAKFKTQAEDVFGPGKGSVRPVEDPINLWSGLRLRLASLLRDSQQSDFEAGVLRVQRGLWQLIDGDADTALLLLLHDAITEVHDYSVRHAMMVAAVCELAARSMPEWDPDWNPTLCCAALTMNLAMTTLQNQLAVQDAPLSIQQRQQVDNHARAGVALLCAAGIRNDMWLEAVAHHHDCRPGPLAPRDPGMQLARLIQRADMFAARLSPRKKRAALSATAAAQAVYLDENRQPDQAGSAIIRAVGMYPPGCLVRLRSGEVGLVLRRGRHPTQPVVAGVVNSAGHPIAEPGLRNTCLRSHEVIAGVAASEVKVRLNIERLIRLA